MKKVAVLCLCAASILAWEMQAQVAGTRTANKPHSTSANPEPALHYSPSLDLASMDRSVDPCVDFYQYSCGGWQKKNPIPADQVSWSVYGKLYQENLIFLRTVLEQAAAEKGSSNAVTQRVGNFYAACMDEATVEKKGTAPIKALLEEIAHVTSIADLAPLVARLQLNVPGPVVFAGGSRQDPDNSEQQIAGFDQGGLGLPDRDYYVADNDKAKEIRDRYVQHVQRMFSLLGDDADTARKAAADVMRIETALAGASMTRVDRRDPYKRKNKIKLGELNQLAPDFNWQAYLRELKAPTFEIINVSPASFFEQLDRQLTAEPLESWKSYLRFHVADAYAPYLSSGFVQENFDFYLKYLRGAKAMQPRWRRCVQFTDRDLGEDLGQLYVSKVFSSALKQNALEMVQQIEAAMDQRIHQLDWMSPETKKEALEKLHGLRNKIGYPDHWRDYSSIGIDRGDFLGNVERSTTFERRRNLNKIGRPVDHTEWGMTPPTVNAYYNSQMNDINFPAGVLQPPLFDSHMDDAPNYGDTGGTIGHELTHGFDDQGSKFDAHGDLREWWTKEDRRQFEERTQCIADQYSQYVVVDDVHINSKLTLGEDVADLGGEILAYMAWREAIKAKTVRQVDGMTPEQRFFVGFAQWACDNERPEEMRVRAISDPHSPARYRINGVVINMPEFQSAFVCKAGQPMVRENRCRVW